MSAQRCGFPHEEPPPPRVVNWTHWGRMSISVVAGQPVRLQPESGFRVCVCVCARARTQEREHVGVCVCGFGYFCLTFPVLGLFGDFSMGLFSLGAPDAAESLTCAAVKFPATAALS